MPRVAEQPAEVPAPKPHEEAPPKEAARPLAQERSGASGAAERFRSRARTWGGWPWLTLATTCLAVVLWVRPAPRGEPSEPPALAHAEASEEDAPEAGTRGLGEAAAAMSMETAPAASLQEKLAQEPLPEPQPGQTRPNATGRCPHKEQTALNQGCWAESSLGRELCAQLNGQMYKGRCYLPIILPRRPPTSSPTDKP